MYVWPCAVSAVTASFTRICVWHSWMFAASVLACNISCQCYLLVLIKLAHLQHKSLLFWSPRLPSVVCCLSVCPASDLENYARYVRNFITFVRNRQILHEQWLVVHWVQQQKHLFIYWNSSEIAVADNPLAEVFCVWYKYLWLCSIVFSHYYFV